MSQSYHRWSTDSDVPLLLQLTTPSQTGATGKTPEVSVRRVRLLDGTALDGWYWDGAGGFNAAPQWFALTEYDASNWPGLYLYDWEQTLVGDPTVYLVYFRHTVSPVGFSVEEHIVTDELFIPTSSPAVPILPGDTVMGRLALMEDPAEAVAQANATAVDEELSTTHGAGSWEDGWSDAEREQLRGALGIDGTKTTAVDGQLQNIGQNVSRIMGLLHDNSIVDNQTYDVNGQLTSARLRVFDSAVNLPATPGGSETVGLLFEYHVIAGYVEFGILNEYKIERVT